MEESKLFTARVQVVEAMERGIPWHESSKQAGLQISQATAYRLRQRMRQGGKLALQDRVCELSWLGSRSYPSQVFYQCGNG